MAFTPDREYGPVAFNMNSADLASSPIRRQSQRTKKPPPITPRRFTKFFTPRPIHGHHNVMTSRNALRGLRGSALNSRANRRSSQAIEDQTEDDLPAQDPKRSSCKRKLSFDTNIPSAQSSPFLRSPFLLPSSQGIPEEDGENHKRHTGSPSKVASPLRTSAIFRGSDQDEEENDFSDDDDIADAPPAPAVRQYRSASTSTNLLFSRLTGRRTRRQPGHTREWQDETADFCSAATDIHHLDSTTQGNHMTIPFCVESCNTNSLVAVGDEEGSIRLLDSSPTITDGFAKPCLTMKPHNNAIMDLTFSDSDDYLATASGDQTCHIIDMKRQTSIYCLRGHVSSVKKVQFQPGSNDKIVASCSRDGQVNVWDLRCANDDRPSLHLRGGDNGTTEQMIDIDTTNQIRGAHTSPHAQMRNFDHEPYLRKRGRAGESSVTSMAFVPDASRNHLLASVSEADATVKLWDMRTAYSLRRSRPEPVSSTAEPVSHQLHRRFGLTSMAFSTDASKLYTLCRDNTVYAYSTAHLVLGNVPELARDISQPRRPGGSERPGLGPLYAFRLPSLRVSTFFIKLAVRRATVENNELLAIGSSDNCAILFPTNESYLTRSNRKRSYGTNRSSAHLNTPPRLQRPDGKPPAPLLHRTSSEVQPSFRQQEDSGIPIYEHGTPLIRGHNKEVTAVSWNYDGSLTTVSDDFSARCWREDGDKSRHLRTLGETGGRRWMSGWAHVAGDDYDE